MAPHHRNRLLATLSADQSEQLTPALERVELPVRTSLVEPGVETPFVYFLETGLASVVASNRGGDQQIEVGHIGYEGMTGTHVVLGLEQTPLHTFMQVGGSGWRLPVEVLRSALAGDEGLRVHLLRYVQAYQLQLAYSALANGRYTILQRLARWLLMCHDRLDTDDMPLTHEFLALMLGVRRSGVTNELHVLEGERAIRATRGKIEVRDRAKLQRLARDSYGIPEAEYERAFGARRAPIRSGRPSLDGKRVLIVEDDFNLAMQMKRHLMALGAHILGPAPNIREALRLLVATPSLDVAMVDVNLQGEMAFPLAEALRKRGVPFIFVSGYGQDLIPGHLADADFYIKPLEPREIAAALLAVA